LKEKKLVPRRRFEEFQNADAWEQRRLIEVADYRNGKAHEQDIDEDGDYIVVNSKFVSTNGRVKKYSNVLIEPLETGEIAFVLSDVPNGKAIARTFLVDENNKYSLNQRIAGITPHNDTEPYFLSILMNRNYYFLKFDTGVGQTNLSKSEVENFSERYPNYDEQRKIGAFFKDIDHLITLHQRKLEKTKALKSAYLAEMFPAEGERVPKRRFAGFIDKWEERQLGEYVTIKSGWSPSNFLKSNAKDNCLFIKVDDLNYSSRGQFDSNMKVQNNSRFIKMKKGSIIFPKRGAAIMTNKVRVLELPAYMDTNMMALEPDNIDGGFLYTFIDKTGLYKIADTSTIPQINNKHIEPYVLFLPSLEEQQAIGEFFNKLDESITNQQQKLEKLKAMKQAYLQEMFV